ncbi:MAG: TadE/TadG family type IV pilus assembly protein, partial [Chloroflexota bacterium]
MITPLKHPPLRPHRPPPSSRSERGSAAVELALILPVLMMLLMMALEGGLFLGKHVSVVNAAREAARYLVDGGTTADLAD